jgi:hypothetical protein
MNDPENLTQMDLSVLISVPLCLCGECSFTTVKAGFDVELQIDDLRYLRLWDGSRVSRWWSSLRDRPTRGR